MARQNKTRRDEEYDWLNDPFDEKKAQADREQAHFSSGTKLALGCGCCAIVIIFIAIVIIGGLQFASIMAS